MLVLAGVLFAYSPGKVKPFLDENGKPLEKSISEKIFVNIGTTHDIDPGIYLN
jgi:hypothetical protein